MQRTALKCDFMYLFFCFHYILKTDRTFSAEQHILQSNLVP